MFSDVESRKFHFQFSPGGLDRCVTGAYSFFEFDAMNKPNSLSVEIAQCLQLLFCLIVVKLLLVESRCKFAVLSLKNFYLGFRYRKLVNRHRKTLAKYVAHRNVFQGIAGGFDK